MELQEITGRTQTFVEAVLQTGDAVLAAKRAGFTNPDRDAYPLLAQPSVRKYIKKRVRNKADAEGLVVCYNFLVSVVRDAEAPKRERIECAKFLYGHHMPGHKAVEAPAGEEDKALNEMSREELRSVIDKAEQELAEQTVMIDITPQGIDSFL